MGEWVFLAFWLLLSRIGVVTTVYRLRHLNDIESGDGLMAKLARGGWLDYYEGDHVEFVTWFHLVGGVIFLASGVVLGIKLAA